MYKKCFAGRTVCLIFAMLMFMTLNANAADLRAISGAASMDTDRYVSFNVYSPGSGLLGNAMIRVKNIPAGGSVIISIKKPDGTSVTDSGGYIFTSNQTIYQNFFNAPSGNYVVNVQPSGNFMVTVIVELNDGFH